MTRFVDLGPAPQRLGALWPSIAADIDRIQGVPQAAVTSLVRRVLNLQVGDFVRVYYGSTAHDLVREAAQIRPWCSWRAIQRGAASWRVERVG